MSLLLNDASVLLNLVATDRLAEIVAALGRQLAICSAVKEEVKKLRDPSTGEMVAVDISQFLDSGLLLVLDLDGETEKSLYINQATFVDDGEAMAIALAASRKLELAIDDRQATNHIRRTFPDLALRTTPDLLKIWADKDGVSIDDVSRAVMAVEKCARYFPACSHPYFAWWNTMRGNRT